MEEVGKLDLVNIKYWRFRVVTQGVSGPSLAVGSHVSPCQRDICVGHFLLGQINVDPKKHSVVLRCADTRPASYTRSLIVSLGMLNESGSDEA